VDGLAAEPGALSLWLSAPALRVELTVATPASTRWRLDLENCVADLALGALGPDGAALAVTAVPSGMATRKSFELDLVPARRRASSRTPRSGRSVPGASP
jgi:hypothetical protein